MIGLPSNTRIWIVARRTNMRKGFDGLAALVQTALAETHAIRMNFLDAAVRNLCTGRTRRTGYF
jgi:hypothetical protein